MANNPKVGVQNPKTASPDVAVPTSAPPTEMKSTQAVIDDRRAELSFGPFTTNEITAISTIVLAVAAVLTLFATLASIWIIRTQLTLTRDALSSTRRSLDIAEEANRIARDHSDRSLRAWIHVELGVESMSWRDEALQIFTNARLLNQGETPAHDIRLTVYPQFIPSVGTVGASVPVDNLPHRPVSSLMPGDDYRHKELFPFHFSLIKEARLKCEEAGFPPIVAIDVVAKYRLESDHADTPDRLTSRRFLLSPELKSFDTIQEERWGWLAQKPHGHRVSFVCREDSGIRNHLT